MTHTGTITFSVSYTGIDATGAKTLQCERQLEQFLAGVERRALRFAEIAVRDSDEAHDLVQDAMIRLARRYAAKPESEWTPLFYRILQNGIRDWYRRQAVRRRVMVWSPARPDATEIDPVADAPDLDGRGPDGTWRPPRPWRSSGGLLQPCRPGSGKPSC